MKSTRHESIDGSTRPHGTRSRYVSGCRCDECKGANARRARERTRLLREREAEVTPSNRPLEGFLTRGGKTFIVKLCPGANGEACHFGDGKRGAWLRGTHLVCARCVERATIWDGVVPAAVARKHIRKLRRAGVGYRSICDAGDVSRTVLVGIIAGTVEQIRKSTERKILAIDAGARAGGAIVDAKPGNAIIARLRRRGLTLTRIGELLGYKSGAPVQLGKRPTMLLETLERLRRLVRQLEREEPKVSKREAEPPRPPDFIPGEWLDDQGAVLPQHRATVAQLRRMSRSAAAR